ncbi:MAG: flagellar hook-basal body complex protein FliE [Verrucomicrobiota bacterium]|jgi:flagellar hook-basal body complex protein FliE
MNPLASIRQLWSAMPTAPADQAGGLGVSIPTAELRALNASQPAGIAAETQPADSSFAGLLGNLVQDVNAKQQLSGQSLRDLQSGQNVSLHQTMITMQEASVSFQLMVEVRNKLLESYQELMRMSV